MEIAYSKQAIKFLEKQDLPTRQRINRAIQNLPKGDVKKLQGQTGYRMRVGDFRVLFDRDGNVIIISQIGPRGQIYK